MSVCKSLFAGLFLMSITACGAGSDVGQGDGGNPLADADPNAPDADTATWVELVAADWTAPALSEPYRCARKTMTQDVYVQAFRALSPTGTHHTVLSVAAPDGPDGELDCSAGDLTHTMLFASGVGTDDLVFPDGVAAKIPAGQQLNLNIHLFNTSDVALAGRAGVLVRVVPAAQVVNEAEMLFGGTVTFSIPPGQTASASGNCSGLGGKTITSIWPHEHQIGARMKVEVMRSGQSVDVLHDQPFDFQEQIQWPIAPPYTLQANDVVRTTCTWTNTTQNTITFGDSSTDEMCFSGLFLYPPRNAGLWCLL